MTSALNRTISRINKGNRSVVVMQRVSSIHQSWRLISLLSCVDLGQKRKVKLWDSVSVCPSICLFISLSVHSSVCLRVRFTNGDQTAVQLIQIKSDLQFDRQIKLKAFHQHICRSDQLTTAIRSRTLTSTWHYYVCSS